MAPEIHRLCMHRSPWGLDLPTTKSLLLDDVHTHLKFSFRSSALLLFIELKSFFLYPIICVICTECSLKIFHFNDLTPFVAKFRITIISRKWPFQFHISRIFDTIRFLHLASHLEERFNDFILFLALSTYPCPFLCLPGIIFARKGNGSPSDAHVPCARFNRSFFVTRDANDPWQTRIRSSYRFVYETRHLWH